MLRLMSARDELKSLDACKSFLEKNFRRDTCGERMVWYHCFWHGTFGALQAASVRSCVRTQKKAKVCIWLECDDFNREKRENAALRSVIPFAKCARFDMHHFAKGTELQGAKVLDDVKNLTLRSDRARYLILLKNGGVYFDLDVIFIRDLSPLLHLEWVYEWSRTGDGNNAIMRLKAGSADARTVVRRTSQLGAKMKSARSVFSKHCKDFKCLWLLPCEFFDPLWPMVDGHSKENTENYCIKSFDEFFTKKKKQGDAFFETCFAYHWHGRWTKKIKAGSWAHHFVHS